MAKTQRIVPFLWFDGQAEEAANFYASLFKNSMIRAVHRPKGPAKTVDFKLAGLDFVALDGGPQFKMNPTASLFVICRSMAETKKMWKALSEGGQTLMPLGKYPWSEQYGWAQDRFGTSWQVMLGNLTGSKQKLVPCLLFSGQQSGLAEAAVDRWVEIFDGAGVSMRSKLPDGKIEYCEFKLDGLTFAAMDNPQPEAQMAFNEAFSFVVRCKNQREVDLFWQKLLADGGSESQCGWLKDRFGVSWQIVPDALVKLLNDPDPQIAQRAAANLFRMKKIDIRQLKRAPKKLSIEVKTTVETTVEKAWKTFTTPADIEKWNHASDDWHCPKAANDLRPGGKFSYAMAARDGSFSFDLEGVFDKIEANKRIELTLADGRKVKTAFKKRGKTTEVVQVFEAETMHPPEMQRAGWLAILENFKRCAEG